MNCPRCRQPLKSTNLLLESLTPHQFQVARRVAHGMTREEVAASVGGMTLHNVAQTLLIIKEKVGVRNDVELALLVHGLLDQAQQTVEEMTTQ